MHSLRNFIQKIKSFPQLLNRRDDIFIVLIIVFIGLSSFGLGRLSALGEGVDKVLIEGGIFKEHQNKGKSISEFDFSSKKYVASVNSSKYHAPWCSGAKRIKEGNKVWFSSKEEAAQAGYTPAANCKGL